MKKNIKRFLIICLCSVLVFNSIFMTSQKEELNATAWTLVLKSGATIKYATILKGLVATTAVLLGVDYVQSSGGLDRMINSFRATYGDDYVESNIIDNEDGTITYTPSLFTTMTEFLKSQISEGDQISITSSINVIPQSILNLMDSNTLATFESYGDTYLIMTNTSTNALVPYAIYDIDESIYRVYRDETTGYLMFHTFEDESIKLSKGIQFYNSTSQYWSSTSRAVSFSVGNFDEATASYSSGTYCYYLYGVASTLSEARIKDGYIVQSYDDGVACVNGISVDFSDLEGIKAILSENVSTDGLTIEMNETIATTIDESTSAKEITETIATTTDDIEVVETTTSSPTIDTTGIIEAIVSLPNAIANAFVNLINSIISAIKDLGTLITDAFSSLFNGLKDFLIYLFVPNFDTWFDSVYDCFEPIITAYNNLFGSFNEYIDFIKSKLGNSSRSSAPPKFEISLQNSNVPWTKYLKEDIVVIDFSFMEIEPFGWGISFHDFYISLISFLMVFFWLQNLIISLPSILGGYYSARNSYEFYKSNQINQMNQSMNYEYQVRQTLDKMGYTRGENGYFFDKEKYKKRKEMK